MNATVSTNSQPVSKAKNASLWALQFLTAAAFLMAGFAKLSGQPMMVETFEKIGIGQSFRFATGGIEVVSAVLLFIPSLTAVGAALLLCTMVGAVFTHLVIIGGSPFAALVLGCFAATILYARFATPKAFLRNVSAPVVAAAEPENAKTTYAR